MAAWITDRAARDNKKGIGMASKVETYAVNSEENGFDKFTRSELARAIELMISPTDLGSRTVMIAILKSQDFEPSEIKAQLRKKEPMHFDKRIEWNY